MGATGICSSEGQALTLSWRMKWLLRMSAAIGTLFVVLAHTSVGADAAFRAWVEALWPEAKTLGVSRAAFDLAFRGVEPDLTLPDLLIPGKVAKERKGQAEFTKTPQQYLDESYLAKLAVQGKALRSQHQAALNRVERELGVDRHIVLAIWGRETAFGTYKLPHYAVKALATQAYLGRRKEMFRKELLFALKMIEDKLAAPEQMRSSWAGAMGLVQLMPSEFYLYPVDFDGDGRKDMFTSAPDALATAAKQLLAKGWKPGVPSAVEVRLPANIDCTLDGPDNARPLSEWQRLGLTAAFGKKLPGKPTEEAYLVLPAGTHGPAFLVYENFKVLRAYNPSDLYALFVASLADRIGDRWQLERGWAPLQILSTAELEEVQTRLQAKRFDIGAKVDGKIGTKTRTAVGLFQKSIKQGPGCWPNAALLNDLRRATPEVVVRN
ncbi:MAG: lytic murein transglycosylase [Hyphomicrobiaceae bacterium]|nr:MAG: lytic murein transglycosylase [Hyphomicrobiaceae bacterium]